MSLEETLIFLVFFGIAFLQLLGRFLKRPTTTETKEEEPAAWPIEAEQPWAKLVERPLPMQPQIDDEARSLESAVFMRPSAALSPEARLVSSRPEPRREAAAPIVPRDRAELRRAIELMAILGPPRSLEPPG